MLPISKMLATCLNKPARAIFPHSLSIVDCYFIFKAFGQLASTHQVKFSRISCDGAEVQLVELQDAFDLYSVAREAEGFEVALVQIEADICLYWDSFDRFVVVSGPEQFIRNARPYPDEIERHRYVESMLYLEDQSLGETPEKLYAALKSA